MVKTSGFVIKKMDVEKEVKEGKRLVDKRIMSPMSNFCKSVTASRK